MSLAGRACIVTGGGSGIGRAIAVRLAAAGARVVIASRTPEDLDATVALASGLPGLCLAHPADVSRSADADALVARCRSEFGRVDILVNNAGTAPLTPFEQMSDDTFHALMAVNTSSVFYMCRAAWSDLRATRGVIVNVSSLSADDPFTGFAAYGGSKAWVNTFGRAIAAEGRPHGIRVFTVAPGAVDTPMLRSSFPEFPDNQMLQPDEVAAAIEWLLDDRSGPASGEVIRVKR